MALVSSSHADHRIYQPSFESNHPSPHEQSKSRSHLLVKIHNCYCKALERLNVRLAPDMADKFFHGGGFCLGFLDPVSNLITNTIMPFRFKRKARVDGVVTKTNLMDLEHRSLDGLVAFLTRFFPYLADCEAVRYLLLADADVLVAARIIALDRHMKNFGESPQALVTALKCAALAARHPYPELLLTAWTFLAEDPSSALDKLSSVVRRRSPSRSSMVISLFGSHMLMLPRPSEAFGRGMPELWHLPAARHPRRCRFPYQHTDGLKRVMLDTIHGFYLKALARLPVCELQSGYHRSLLAAGHCYGPLDPVSKTPTSSSTQSGPDTSVYEAFKAAAVAARHPKPDDQVNLFHSCEQKLSSLLPLLQGGGHLSSNDVHQISRLLCPDSLRSEQSIALTPLGAPLYEHIRVSKKVNAVLNTYNSHQSQKYQDQVICGVNSQVSGPVYCPGGSRFAPHKCLRTHVNFTVTGEACGLFFAELSNDDDAGAGSFCCPVSMPLPCSERCRCLFCDFTGITIVHPVDQNFYGREKEFEKMYCGQDPCEKEPTMMKPYYTNTSIICHSDLIADEIGMLKEDCLYKSSDEPKNIIDLYMAMDDYTSSDDSMSSL